MEHEQTPHPFSESVQKPDGFHHVATVDIAAGQVVCRLSGGRRLDRPTRYSIQVGPKAHLDVHPPLSHTQHSCEPNCHFRFERAPWPLVSARDIAKGEDITFCYPTTEYESGERFPCACKAPSCVGVFHGYQDLSDEQKQRIEPFISPVIKEMRQAPNQEN